MHHVAANLRVQQDRDDVQRTAGQCISGRDRTKRIGEQQQRRAKHARPQHRQRHVAPVLEGRAAEAVTGFAPLALQAVERGRDDQHHQRNLEVQVSQRQPGKAQNTEARRVQIEADNFFSNTVTRPTRPSVQMKANASGTPAKFEATPENVINVGRIQPGNLPCTAAHASGDRSTRRRARKRRSP